MSDEENIGMDEDMSDGEENMDRTSQGQGLEPSRSKTSKAKTLRSKTVSSNKRKKRRLYKSRYTELCTNTLHHRKALGEEDKLYCSKHPGIYIKICQNSRTAGRVFDIVHSCIYCGKLLTNIHTHLESVHSNEVDVKEVIRIKNDKDLTNDMEVRMKLDKLLSSKQCLIRNKGDHKHNQLVWKSKSGELLISRRVRENFNSELYRACPDCLEWYHTGRPGRQKHYISCPALTDSTRTKVDKQKPSNREILIAAISVLPNDEVTKTATTDPLIVSLGEIHYSTSIGDSKKRKHHASSRMRIAAQLLHLIRKEIDSEDASMSDCLNVGNIKTLVKCALFVGDKKET